MTSQLAVMLAFLCLYSVSFTAGEAAESGQQGPREEREEAEHRKKKETDIKRQIFTVYIYLYLYYYPLYQLSCKGACKKRYSAYGHLKYSNLIYNGEVGES